MTDLEKEAEQLIESFREKIKKAADEVLSKAYVDYVPHIESDAWLNFRNEVRHEFVKEYATAEVLHELHRPWAWAYSARRRIYEDNKEEIVKLLNADLLEDIEELKLENRQLIDKLYDHLR